MQRVKGGGANTDHMHTTHNDETITITVRHNSSVTCMYRGSTVQLHVCTEGVQFSYMYVQREYSSVTCMYRGSTVQLHVCTEGVQFSYMYVQRDYSSVTCMYRGSTVQLHVCTEGVSHKFGLQP